MGLFTRKPKRDTENQDYIARLIKEELEVFQKEIDERYNYRTGLNYMVRGVDCCFPLGAYSIKKNDAMLMRYELAFSPLCPSVQQYYSSFTMYIRAHFIDLLLHPEDTYKSSYEKYNTCSLRPMTDRRDKENVAAWGLDNDEAVKYIRAGFERIGAKIDSHILAKFGTVSYAYVPDHTKRFNLIYDAKGKPEQYKEYFANVAKANPQYALDAKQYARQYGLTLTDEDIRNAKGINYLIY